MDSKEMPPSSLDSSTAWSGQIYYKRTPRKGYVQYWGVLLHRSVSNPYRIELYEKSKDQRPQLVISLESVLCIKPLEGKGKEKSRKYEFQIITVSSKHQFATKEAEGCRAWVKKLNRQLFGPPEAGVLYEYRVQIVPTGYSGNLGLHGSYIMRISDTAVMLFSANGILPTHFQCSLSNVSQAHHLKVSEHGKKQNILIIRTDKDAEIGEGGYAFYADTASEIASIIEHRRKSLHSHKGKSKGTVQSPLSPGDVGSLLGGHALRLHTSGSDISSQIQQATLERATRSRAVSWMPCVPEDSGVSLSDAARHSRQASADGSTPQSSLGVTLKQFYSDSKLRKETAPPPRDILSDQPPLPPPRASSLTSPTSSLSPQFHPRLGSLVSPALSLSPQFHLRASSTLPRPTSPHSPQYPPASSSPNSPHLSFNPALSPTTLPRSSRLASQPAMPSPLNSLDKIRPRSSTGKAPALKRSQLESQDSIDSDFEAVNTWLLDRPCFKGSLSSPGHDDARSRNENGELDDHSTDGDMTILEKQQKIEQETLEAGYMKIIHSNSHTLDSRMRNHGGKKKQPKKPKKVLLRRASSVELGLKTTSKPRKLLAKEGCNKSMEDLILATPGKSPPDPIDTSSSDEITPYAVLDGFLLNEIDTRPPAVLPRLKDFTPVEEVRKNLCQGLDGIAIRKINAKETASDYEEVFSEAEDTDSDVEGGYITLVNQGQYLDSEYSDHD